MQAGGDVDAGLVGVIDAQPMPLDRVPTDALGARQAADARDVHLGHVDAAQVHEGAEFGDVANLLAGRDANRTLGAELAIALDIAAMQRLFQPCQAERLELPGPADGAGRVPPPTGTPHPPPP